MNIDVIQIKTNFYAFCSSTLLQLFQRGKEKSRKRNVQTPKRQEYLKCVPQLPEECQLRVLLVGSQLTDRCVEDVIDQHLRYHWKVNGSQLIDYFVLLMNKKLFFEFVLKQESPNVTEDEITRKFLNNIQHSWFKNN
ncbi:hypothetical protein BpHYR1_018206 [Brachionus plicatilis]|uniref:Uncharacterized protein n=1 Tax=Brachionus plicatilis TaxID=10195 RepID=A0A3M7S2J7_BRAPC|nr:hypothetical protein BpHYR1_018206 [Brachionus plicatilis]